MDSNETDYTSRTQKKKEAKELQVLGEKLVELTVDQISTLELPDKLHKALLEAQTIKKHEARRRQLQFIGGLMRSVDPEPIRRFLEKLSAGRKDEARKFKQLEDLRDGLISGSKDLHADVIAVFPNADRQHLNQLIRNARKEKAADKPPKSARALFRYLREFS